MADKPAVSFAALLRQLRVDAGLTQEELAAAAQLSTRAVSDLERGVNVTARSETARLLAGALELDGPARMLFEAAARGRILTSELPVAVESTVGLTSARTLPHDVVSFTGREPELRRVLAMADSAGTGGGVVSICAIGGMAGIGKTALAVHAAHRLAPSFPDGQIFLPLHGHTPDQQPVDPAEALASLLLTIGVSAAQIPPGLQARTGLWRDRLAGRRLLLVLDDAVGHEQVRPLLPGTAGSMVLVTSRRHLTALEDSHTINLDTLPQAEAAQLLVQLADRHGLDPTDSSVTALTRLCGQLPLAIGMLARQLHHHPAWTTARLATDLAAARDRLEYMHAENLSVAAAFDLSYADLADEQQQVFRRLGLHPGNEVDAYAVAALDCSTFTAARRNLEALYDHHLLTEPADGRYLLHDLIRAHARTRAADDPAADRQAALGRLLDYFLHTTRATERYFPRRSPGVVVETANDPPKTMPDLPDRHSAVSWMESERLNLYAAVSDAAALGRHDYAIALVFAMHAFLRGRGYWDQALFLYHLALRVVRDAGDLLGEAGVLTGMGDLQALTADSLGAAASLARALELYRGLRNSRGEASALNEFGALQQELGDHPAAAADSHQQALRIYRELGDRAGEASALNELGAVQHAMTKYPAATASLQQALEIFRDLENRLGEASALNRLGLVQRTTGNYRAAAAGHQLALDLHRDLGNRIGEASALHALGHVHRAMGDNQAANSHLQESIGICRELSYRIGEARALNELGEVQRDIGDYLAAITSLEQAFQIYQAIGHRRGEADALSVLGAVQHAIGDYAVAAASYDQALAIARELDQRRIEATVLSRRATTLALRGDSDEAAADLARALAIQRDLAVLPGQAETLNATGDLLLARAQPDDALPHYQRALTIASTISYMAEQAHALEGIGLCHSHAGGQNESTSELRQALSIYQRIGSPKALQIHQILADHAEPGRRTGPAGAG